MKPIKVAFESQCIVVPLTNLLPSRSISASFRGRMMYKRVGASIAQVGLVEPLVVFPLKDQPGKYLIRDGNVRWDILRSLGLTEARCIVALDDEGFTYNKHVNPLSTVEGHFMILRAIKHGVPEERVAEILDVNVAKIRRQVNMLDGVCPEAVAILKDRPVTANAFKIMGHMAPIRQMEAADVMVASNNYSVAYAKMLLATTPKAQLLEATERPKAVRGISAEQAAQMTTEMESLHRQMKQIEASYGTDHLLLMLARGYLAKLLANSRIVHYLSQKHPEILQEIQTVLQNVTAENGGSAPAIKSPTVSAEPAREAPSKN
jgi:RepB plasmid partitioning protein/ParB-like nuclease domain